MLLIEKSYGKNFLNIFFFYYYMVSVIFMFNGFTFKTNNQTNFEWGLNYGSTVQSVCCSCRRLSFVLSTHTGELTAPHTFSSSPALPPLGSVSTYILTMHISRQINVHIIKNDKDKSLKYLYLFICMKINEHI